jgi:hypothetical protein
MARTTTRVQIEQVAADNAAALAARDSDLFGRYLEDDRLLRSRDYQITRDGADFTVDGNRVDGETVRALADRQRRLSAPTQSTTEIVTPAGLKVGDSVPLARARRRTKAKPQTLEFTSPREVRPTLSGAAAMARTKASEYSTDLGTRPRVVWVGLELLSVDRRYQREITRGGQTHINRILRGFNWNRFQPILVTEGADGTYAVIDGQHRLEAAKKHPLIDELPCYVIDTPEVATQAEIFVSVNSDRRALTGLQKFWASVAAGNKEAQVLARTCEEAGVVVPRNPPPSGLKARMLLGPNVAVRLVGRFGRQAVIDAIKLLAEAWPDADAGFRICNLAAVAAIASTPYDRDRTLKALKGLEPEKLYAEALAGAGHGSTNSLAASSEKLIRKAMR